MMKFYRAHWDNYSTRIERGLSSVSNWYHTKEEAKQEALDQDCVWTFIEVATFESDDHAENIRRFMNQTEYDEEEPYTVSVEERN